MELQPQPYIRGLLAQQASAMVETIEKVEVEDTIIIKDMLAAMKSYCKYISEKWGVK